MKVMAQLAMVMNLGKCIGCHSCPVTSQQAWTNRSGVEWSANWDDDLGRAPKPGT